MKKFVEPEIDVKTFEIEDIITTSDDDADRSEVI